MSASRAGGGRPCRSQDVRSAHPHSRITERRDDRRPNALGPAGHKRPLSGEAQVDAHDVISSAAILSPSSSKRYRSSTGLPGKFPVRRLVTTMLPPCCSDAMGVLVYL